jgi:16S rRNA (adenine1518-N6/adenine1519-N6)-dimethyltransferase
MKILYCGAMAGQRLGQHFLTRPEIAGWVADAVPLGKESVVLEVGPGKGILTAELLHRAGTVVAVEKDEMLVPVLRERFADEIASGRLILVEQDVRDFDPSAHPMLTHGYSLVANIPYYITGAIIRQFLTTTHQPVAMALLVQKEVAERVVAGDGKDSLLSLSVKAYGTPRYVKTVRAGSFSPPPKVDSAILAIDEISRNHFVSEEHEEKFFEVLHAGFKSKRKMLAGNLGRDFATAHFDQCGIPKNARAEDVPTERWLCLAKA